VQEILPPLDESSASEGIVEKSPVLLFRPDARSASDPEGGEQ
jgi:hypothetical protein